jgi:hypothetical protein
MIVPQQPSTLTFISALLMLLLLYTSSLQSNDQTCFAFTTTTSTLSFVRSTNTGINELSTITTNRRVTSLQLSSTAPKKGFGSDKPDETVNSKKEKPKSAGAQKRDEFSKKYDAIAATGGQEYRIFVRQFGSNDQSWLPCGLIAVPRGSQVSTAIYSNVIELQSAIVRTYPKLKGMESEFEYGYNLKIYPDDPIEVAKNTGPTNNNLFSFGGWMKNLLSPIDTSNMSRPPPPP